MDTRTTLAIIAALAAVAVLVGARVTKRGSTRTNLTFIGVGLLLIAGCFLLARLTLS
ncbi:hypothetical protein QLQ12_30845 [Actinoplanes sp. NEAU-A12]|uniref:LPXTG cell wall anchor domain-containing protein n=1 Tax=Actinoplanes sandaracinus TaxID=3045177 RepID=A0ABT6WTF1_9ACTN|nr:hypothetical protein [Actinoplanes sandaracinus]MDI6103021.1 hypothetical protein [Actinoplanes sandaracinus]